MQTFCTDTILVLRSSWRGSYRTAWPIQTPSLRPLLPPQCWPKEKSGREIVPKCYPSQTKEMLALTIQPFPLIGWVLAFPFWSPVRWHHSLGEDCWVHPTPSLACLLFREDLWQWSPPSTFHMRTPCTQAGQGQGDRSVLGCECVVNVWLVPECECPESE